MAVRAGALGGALCALALCPAAAAATPPARVLLVFVPGPASADEAPPSPDPLLRALEARGLAVGLMSPTQGTYSPEQALLDVTQGARVSPIVYPSRRPAPLRLAVSGGHGQILGWPGAVRRAARAPGEIVPGRLASAIPGGAAFAGISGAPTLDAVAGADRGGRVAEVSLGPAGTLPARARALLARHRLVVAELAPPARSALRSLDALLAARAPAELLIVAQSPPDIRSLRPLPVGLAGAAARGALTSDSTRTEGVLAGIDLLPTVLGHLGLPVAGGVTGRPIRVDGLRSASRLERLRLRYTHVAPRRIRTLEVLLATWAALALALAAIAGPAGARRGLRVGGLAFLWVPSVVLVPVAFDPPQPLVEAAGVAAGALVLGLLTDLSLRWPRGPAVPAAVCLVAYAVDLAADSHLLDLSMLGPNPRGGARFFGIGNELEAALPVVFFAGLAAAAGARPRSRGLGLAFAAVGAAVAVVVGWGYLGADVGGVITVSAGAAVATLAILPGGLTWRRLLAAVCVPPAALGALALLDLATGASSHFSRNVLEVEGGAGLGEVIGRRYQLAWHALGRGLMPVATAAALLAGVAGIVLRSRLYGHVHGPAWSAALAGGLAAGVVGALSNDSGPLLLVVAVFVLGVVTAYLVGGSDQAPSAPAPAAVSGRAGGVSARATVQESASATDGPEGGRPSATVP